MTHPKNIRIIQAAQTFFRIGYGIFWIAAAIALLLAVILPFSSEMQNELCRIPIGFAIKDAPAQFALGGTSYTTEVIRAGGYLHIVEGPLLFSYLGLFTFALFLAAGLYVMRQILRMIARVKKGDFFISGNVSAMKKIGIALIVLWALNVLIDWGYSLLIGRHFFSDTLMHTGILGRADIGDLTLPILLIVLSEVFRAGISLKEDQDLTV